jgi:hypothetical protein
MTKDAPEPHRIEAKLDTLIRLVAIRVVADKKKQAEKAVILRRAGIGPKEIAAICGTTPKTISVALAQSKMKGKRPAKGRSRSRGKRR